VLPVLFSVFGFDIQSYGVSKAVAALVAAFLLARAFEGLALKRDLAYSLVMWATLWGLVGAKSYYLLEQLPDFDVHHLGGMGFTWYGGLIGAYLVLSGISRFLVEFLRINQPVLLGLTQPQLWALVSLIVGVVLIVRTQCLKRPARTAAEVPVDGAAVTARSDDLLTVRSTS
jgi:prolipoprotein diacylglyceryltransferase